MPIVPGTAPSTAPPTTLPTDPPNARAAARPAGRTAARPAGRTAGAAAVVVADRLLGAMATVRRAVHRLPELPERPAPLCTLTAAQGELVRLVRRRPGVSVAEAAEELRLAPNTVSTLVGQLTEQGVLLRVADPADRRVARLDLDPDARRKVTAWRDRRSEAVAAAVGRLGADDRRVLADAAAALERLAEAVHREVVHRAAEEAG